MNESADAETNAAVRPLHDLFVVAGYETTLQAVGLDTLEAWFHGNTGESLAKPGLEPWRERFRLMIPHCGQPRTFYLKRFCNPPPAIRREIRRSGTGADSVAGLEWCWMHRLARDGIPCVKPIAYGQEMHGTRQRRSAVLSEAVPGRSLEAWADEWQASDRVKLRPVLVHTARLIARFHALGYVHRDLYLAHLFYDPTQPMDRSLHLIDLQRVMQPRWRRRRWIVKDLAALNYSAPPHLLTQTDRLRWLKQYLKVSKLDRSARTLVDLVHSKTKRIARHDRRRHERRPISHTATEVP